MALHPDGEFHFHTGRPLAARPHVTEQVCDAGDLGCGDGLAAWFRDRLRETQTGVVLRTIVRDPAARVELPALARLMGQRVVSIEELDEHLTIRVEKIT